MPDNLFDDAVRRQMLLERLKAGQVRGFMSAFREVEKAVRAKFGNLSGELNAKSKRALAGFLKGLEKDLAGIYRDRLKLYRVELAETAGVYVAAEAFDLGTVVGKGRLKVPDKRKAFAGALARPMGHSGESLDEFLETFSGRQAKKVTNTIRRGYVQGLTNAEVVRGIIGTKAAKYKDGLLASSRRETTAVVRTATQHVASSARFELWEANKDVVQQYQWVSTLDRSTTPQCKSLDGQVFEFGKGPVPPVHIQCRSTTIAKLAPEFEFLERGRTRSAEFGPTDAKENYYDWLKRQDASVQKEALGPTRAKLFAEGGLSPDEFAKLNLGRNFQPLTLEQMRALEPEAFKAAGL